MTFSYRTGDDYRPTQQGDRKVASKIPARIRAGTRPRQGDAKRVAVDRGGIKAIRGRRANQF
jgi:hypothetical protein